MATPEVGSPSSAPVALGTGAGPVLHYAWKVGMAYQCDFTLEGSIDRFKPSVRGQVVYEPTSADPSSMESDETKEGDGSGTGFAVTPDGVLITCAHVVHGGIDIKAVYGQKSYPVRVIAYDGARDLAVLKIEATELPVVSIADSNLVELGQDVRAVGYPLSTELGESIKMTTGTIAGVIQKKGEKMFQIDASINPGNSGGPLVDGQGRVVGVTNAMLAGEEIDKVGFSIPVNDAVALARTRGVELRVEANAAGPSLEGRALARRVTPAVALLKVKIGRGGVGIAPQKIVKFRGGFSISGLEGLGLPARGQQESGKMLVDTRGKIEAYEGELRPPLLSDPLGKIGMEVLPEDGRRKWTSLRMVGILKREQAPQSDDGLPGLDFRPRFGPRPPFGRRPFGSPLTPPSTVVRMVPALEETRYQITSESADGTVSIQKEYELTSLQGKDQTPLMSFKGSGTLTWDKNLGFPRRSEFKATMVENQGNVSVSIPFTLNYQIQQKEPGQVAQFVPPSAPAVAMPVAIPGMPGMPGMGASPSKPTLPPGVRVPSRPYGSATVPSRPTRPPSSSSRPPSSARSGSKSSGGGLNQFNPNE